MTTFAERPELTVTDLLPVLTHLAGELGLQVTVRKSGRLAELNARPVTLSPELRPDASYLDTHLAYARDAWEGQLV